MTFSVSALNLQAGLTLTILDTSSKPSASTRSFFWLIDPVLQFFWINAKLWQCGYPARNFPCQLSPMKTDRVHPAFRFFLVSIYGGHLELVKLLSDQLAYLS
ncbi:hypothetical protein F511_18497 [Dorcoceras hygrometricum]|uniref:Uncharacterized protein n=1 Tax=Dorcoceras hygrometricum TaxID=472368 RepID=A0A2Z7BBQ7_9LAMI|nr:hypothetical protein F511_18497 [Dorcoceras hygrometricum]